jgi:hypothetical protein
VGNGILRAVYGIRWAGTRYGRDMGHFFGRDFERIRDAGGRRIRDIKGGIRNTVGGNPVRAGGTWDTFLEEILKEYETWAESGTRDTKGGIRWMGTRYGRGEGIGPDITGGI